MDTTLLTYLPMDRCHALAQARELPEYTSGTALFADVSGFTPLTETLTRDLGPHRGVEELLRYLNQLYDTLIGQVHQYGGSVIGFAGDAITCWFDGDTAGRATACALAMQGAMDPFAPSLTIKVAVASGPVRRLLVGDPTIQRLEVLAGETLTRLAHAEHLAQKGEVVLDTTTATHLQEPILIREWREQGGMRVAVVEGLGHPVAPRPWPPLAAASLTEAQVHPWVLPVVHARLQAGHGEFLTELRPVVALFLRFTGLDYDGDAAAGSKFNGYVAWVQNVVVRYGGTLVDITMGDKGSYLYVAFGAPIAHEDDAERALRAALELRQPPEAIGMASLQIGISRGTMRTGAYGGSTRRTYGVLGDEVNLAARLMQLAAPGQILVSGRVQQATHKLFCWQGLSPAQVKGKAAPIPLFSLLGERPSTTIHLQEPTYTLPMVGRQSELTRIEASMDLALAGQGQLVGITGEAGMGKSRLVAEVVRRAVARRLVAYGGECQSYGTNIPYLLWQPIWRALFNLDSTASLADQEQALAQALEEIDPALLPRLPLLAPVLNLPLADNELTRPFDAQVRKRSRETLLLEVLRKEAEKARQASSALLLVLEDVHWLDALSHDLLDVIAQASATLPLLIVLAYRPPTLAHLQTLRVMRLTHFHEFMLGDLSPPEMAQLVAARAGQMTAQVERPLPKRLLQQLLARAQGTPFYAEELLNYLHDQGLDPWDEHALDERELPTSLHSLVLSRIDQLSEPQKITVKVASVIGRVFSFRWLLGYYPTLGTPGLVRADLEELRRLDITPLEQPEPELTYLFKHIVTQEVAYGSMAHDTRTILHEQLATFLEQQSEEVLDLLAYHHGRGNNLAKKRYYLQRAAEVAQATYANEAAIDYYSQLLPLLESLYEQSLALLQLGKTLQWTGKWAEAEQRYRQALERAQQPGQVALCESALGALAAKQRNYPEAHRWMNQALATYELSGESEGLTPLLAELGILSWQQDLLDEAEYYLGRSRALAEQRQDLKGVAHALCYLGIVALSRNLYAEAETLWQQSLALCQRSGDEVGAADNLNCLGFGAYFQGEYRQARAYMEQSLATSQRVGDRESLAMSLNGMGHITYAQGEHLTAHTHYLSSLRLSQEFGDPVRMARSLMGIAGVMARMQPTPARARWSTRLLSAARATMESLGSPLLADIRPTYERAWQAVEELLDRESLDQAWAEGQALALAQAVAEAVVEQL